MPISLRSAAELIAVFGGAGLTFSTIAFAIYKGASKAFAQGVTLHVAPLFDELKTSLATLNTTMRTVKDEHEAVVERVNERLTAHDETLVMHATQLGAVAERTARLEGRAE